jgi:hypothetical protein
MSEIHRIAMLSTFLSGVLDNSFVWDTVWHCRCFAFLLMIFFSASVKKLDTCYSREVRIC